MQNLIVPYPNEANKWRFLLRNPGFHPIPRPPAQGYSDRKRSPHNL